MKGTHFLAVLCAGSILAGALGVCAGFRAERMADASRHEALEQKLRADRLERMLGIARAEARPVRQAQVGKSGTLARKARNYCNVKAPSDTYWQGQCGRDAHGHAIFRSPEWSLRAGAIVLRNYARRHGIHTVRGIVERFSRSNHAEYIAFLCRRLGVKPDERIDVVRRMPELLPAMVRFETGARVAPEHIAILDFLKES
jgi:hypothetical protein